MTSTPLAVPETDLIAALLSELTGRVAPPPAPAPPKRPKTSVPPPPPIAVTTTQVVRSSVRQMLQDANWRNEAPEPIAPPPIERPTVTEPGPLPAPFGVLTVATLFGLVNWRNRPDEARPLPTIKPPPPPGAEFTVEAMMTTFGWE